MSNTDKDGTTVTASSQGAERAGLKVRSECCDFISDQGSN